MLFALKSNMNSPAPYMVVSPKSTVLVTESDMVNNTLLISHVPTIEGSTGAASSSQDVPNATNANAKAESLIRFFLIIYKCKSFEKYKLQISMISDFRSTLILS